MMLPEPVSTIAVNVVGPSGLMSGRGLSVAVPDFPVVRLTQVTFSGSFCSGAGPGVPTAVNTYAACPGPGPGVGMSAGPATEIAVAKTFPPSARQPLLIEGYMNSCVGGLSGANPGGAVFGPDASGDGAGAGGSTAESASGTGAAASVTG